MCCFFSFLIRFINQALAKGKEFQNKVLDIQWFNRRSQIPSEKDDSKAEMTAQDILATLDDEDDVKFYRVFLLFLYIRYLSYFVLGFIG